MRFQPRIRRDIKLKFAMLDRTVIPFANVCEPENAARFIRCNCRSTANTLPQGSDDRESNGIPVTLGRRPDATAGVSEVAEGFEDVLGRYLLFVPWRRAVSLPSAAKGQARRMRPTAILHFLDGHEKRTGQRKPLSWKFRDWTL